MKLKSQGNSIKLWAEDDRPREKALTKGVRELSNAELLAILLGSGNAKKSAVDLSKEILQSINNNLDSLGKMSYDELIKYQGIGMAKAVTILSAMELGKRRKLAELADSPQIKNSDIAAQIFVEKLGDEPCEEFWIMLLNKSNKIIEIKKVSSGGLSETSVDVRVIMKMALEKRTCGMIVSHNHPSGSLVPSDADKSCTRKLAEACKIMNIKFFDHIIKKKKKYYSFADEGLL